MNRLFIFLLIPLVFLACSQPEGELIIVPDNIPPPDLSVPEVVKDNYVNKLFISLLGRKPSALELNGARAFLDKDNAAPEDRKALVADILDQREFSQRTFDIARVEILNNLDTADITENIFIFNLLKEDPQYADFIDLIDFEIGRLVALKRSPEDLESGQISRIDMHRRCVDNSFYDEINMGTQNFVLAMFEYFLDRYPTEAEEQNAILMIDGFNSVLFGVEGKSKEDYLDIFFGSDDYFEGQVVDIYQDFMFRSPHSLEMSTATIDYQQSRNYRSLLTDILTTDEYLGL
ncbi:MAG: hypothetical protein AAF587_04995 [Bacteroidota bacterium]